MTRYRIAVALSAVALVGACSSTPPPPDWQMNAKDGLQRAVAAYLQGNARVEALEFSRARAEVARTARADLLARVELMRCAARVASLVFDDCPGFAPLAQDASAAERAYADYLAGTARPEDAALLPAQQRDMAASKGAVDALNGISDPLSRLVAAGVLLRSGRAEPGVFAVATDTASAQGWIRPLLAWLNVQAKRAEDAGESNEAARVRRRIAMLLEAPPKAASAP